MNFRSLFLFIAFIFPVNLQDVQYTVLDCKINNEESSEYESELKEKKEKPVLTINFSDKNGYGYGQIQTCNGMNYLEMQPDRSRLDFLEGEWNRKSCIDYQAWYQNCVASNLSINYFKFQKIDDQEIPEYIKVESEQGSMKIKLDSINKD